MSKKDKLLILTLDTPGVRQDLQHLAPKLRNSVKWGKIYLTPDLTRALQGFAHKFQEELAASKAAGESKLTIPRGRVISTAQKAEAVAMTQSTNSRVMQHTNEASSESMRATFSALQKKIYDAELVQFL